VLSALSAHRAGRSAVAGDRARGLRARSCLYSVPAMVEEGAGGSLCSTSLGNTCGGLAIGSSWQTSGCSWLPLREDWLHQAGRPIDPHTCTFGQPALAAPPGTVQLIPPVTTSVFARGDRLASFNHLTFNASFPHPERGSGRVHWNLSSWTSAQWIGWGMQWAASTAPASIKVVTGRRRARGVSQPDPPAMA